MDKTCGNCGFLPSDGRMVEECKNCVSAEGFPPTHWKPKGELAVVDTTADDYMNKVVFFKNGDQFEPQGVITAVDISNPARLIFGVTPFDKIPHNLGKWITSKTTLLPELYCNQCGHESPGGEKWKFCPNCGALMEEETE